MPSQAPDLRGIYTIEKAEEDIATLRGQVAILTEANTQADANLVPNTPTAGNTQFSSTGQQKYVGSDGLAYNTGRLSMVTANDQTINSTSQATVTGLAATVAALTYRVDAAITCVQGATAAVQAFRINGPTTTNIMIPTWFFEMNSNAMGGTVVWTTYNADSATSTGFGAGHVFTFHMRGTIAFSAAGSFHLDARCVTASADTYTVKAGSYMDLMPVT